MFRVLSGSDAAQYMNPYAVDVIRTKRKDLVYGISHTEVLLDLLVTEGVMTAAKRSIVLTIRTRKDQNSRVLDLLEARGERACRKFFHPCLMLAEPELYQRIRTYVGSVSERVRDTRRQLIGYLLDRDQEAVDRKTAGPQKTHTLLTIKENRRRSFEKGPRRTEPPGGSEDKPPQNKLENLIHTIAAQGEAELLEELLDGTDINTVNSSNQTLLHVAAEHGRSSITELLVRKGARLDLQDHTGRTALHRAACRGHSRTVEVLTKAGAPVHALDLQGKTPVHLAAENQHLDCVGVLVQEEARQSQNHTQDTFLHMAAVQEDRRLVELLLQSGADVNAADSQKKTALFQAVQRNDDRTVRVLLNAGAEVDSEVLREALDLHQETVLQLLLAKSRLSKEVLGSALLSAVRQNRDGAVVAALIEGGAEVNSCDPQGYTPLLLAAQLGHSQIFRVLVEKQADLGAALSDRSSAVHLAVLGGAVTIVQTLLDEGLDPNGPGAKGRTPLHLAAEGNRPDLAALLLKAGAQVDAVTQDGLTPLHTASQQGHADTVVQLLKAKADPGARDRLGRTALHRATSLRGGRRVVDLLLSAKADPNATDHEKKTALHLAAVEGNVDAVTSLLSHKAKGGARDMDGSTPLHYAAAGGHVGVVSALLQALGSRGIEDRNAWRKTPLHAAAERGHDGVVGRLLEAGAKTNSTDHCKDTALHCAARGGHQEAVERLVNWGRAGTTGRRNTVNLQAANNVGKTALQVAEGGATTSHQNITALLKRKMFLSK